MTEPGAKDSPAGINRKSDLDARIRAVIGSETSDAPALHALGLEVEAAGRPADALDLFSRAVELSPDSKMFVLSAAKVLMAEGMFQQAALAYLQAQEIDPKDPSILVELATALRRGNREDEARAVVSRAEQLARDVECSVEARLPSIIVASSGYCGAVSLVAALEEHGFRRAPAFLTQFADLKPDCGGIVYETYALPPTSLPDGFQVIFLFGNPVVTVLSACGDLGRGRKLQSACHHGDGAFAGGADLLRGDALGLTEHFVGWFQCHPFPVLACRYPDVFRKECTLAVEQFIETKFAVATYEQRTLARDAHGAAVLRETFKELLRRIEVARPVTVLGDIRG